MADMPFDLPEEAPEKSDKEEKDPAALIDECVSQGLSGPEILAKLEEEGFSVSPSEGGAVLAIGIETEEGEDEEEDEEKPNMDSRRKSAAKAAMDKHGY